MLYRYVFIALVLVACAILAALWRHTGRATPSETDDTDTDADSAW